MGRVTLSRDVFATSVTFLRKLGYSSNQGLLKHFKVMDVSFLYANFNTHLTSPSTRSRSLMDLGSTNES